MAGKRLTQITSTSDKNATNDLLMVVDVSDTSGSPQGSSKKTTIDTVCVSKTIVLPNAQVQALHTTPRAVVTAESGYYFIPLAIQFGAVWTGSTPANETTTYDLYFSYENPGASGFPVGWGGILSYFAHQRQVFQTAFSGAHGSQWYTANLTNSKTPQSLISGAGAQPFCASNSDILVWASAAPAGGYDMTVTTTYQKIKV